MADMKHGLTRGQRAKLSILGRHALIYMQGGMAYGADKYARGNYHGPPPAGVTPVERFLGYIDAAMRHLTAVSQAINVALGTGGDLAAACATPDDEASGSFPASHLPHLSHALASLHIAVEVGVQDHLIPADPGHPWMSDPLYAEVQKRRGAAVDIPQKDDPDAERRRVENLELRARIDKAERERGVPVDASIDELREARAAILAMSDIPRDAGLVASAKQDFGPGGVKF